MLIRQAQLSDAPELALLTTQLGYPASEKTIRDRLERILSHAENALFVAEGPDHEVAGWIHGFLCQLLESRYRVEIGGLIVGERFRRKGVGQQLVKTIGEWAAEQGASELSVRCREERPEAHEFYQALAFRYVKTQRSFRKQIE